MALSVLLLTAIAAAQDQSWKKHADAVVRVHTPDGAAGSGVLIYICPQHQVGYIVTNAHVLCRGPGGQGAENPHATASFRGGFRDSGQICGVDREHDIGVFVCAVPDGASAVPLATSDQQPAAGDRVDCLGYGAGSTLVHWWSEVHGFKAYRNYYIRLDPFARHGDSGGPILYQGRVVGLVSGYEMSHPQGAPVDAHGPRVGPIRRLIQRIVPCWGGG